MCFLMFHIDGHTNKVVHACNELSANEDSFQLLSQFSSDYQNLPGFDEASFSASDSRSSLNFWNIFWRMPFEF